MGSNWDTNGVIDATSPKDDGRKVRELNSEMEWAVKQAKRLVTGALAEADALKRVEALARALGELETASIRCQDIEDICRAAARRGPYKEDGDG